MKWLENCGNIFEELAIRFVWLKERMEHSASLGFELTMNWGAWFGWMWLQFLVTILSTGC